jgi:transposase
MAYLRSENKKGKTYLSICESYRNESGKPQRRVLHQLGNIETLGAASLQRIAEQILLKLKPPSPSFEPQELERLNYGFAHVIYQVLLQYNLVDVFRRLTKKHKLSFSLLQPILLMLCDRLNDPISKLGSYNIQLENYGIKDIELHHIYRSLDYLHQHNELLQQHIYESNKNLFNYHLDVVFFDVTTFYFDSDKVAENSLRQHGFGKDGKIGKTQILFSLLIDKNKMPIGFEVFDGKKFEGHTLEIALKKLKEKYSIEKVIVVADSGMMNKQNISLFGKEGSAEQYEYIVGDRLKNLPHTTKNQLIDKANYTHIITSEDGITTQACVVKTTDKTIIGTWSAKRAAKDKNDREARKKKAETLLKNPTQLHKKAKHYYIKNTAENNYQLDLKKIAEDARYDGFKAISTNTSSISIEQVIEQYSHLYTIEQSFRTFKSFLETRPMFHWTNERIQGHLVMCYIAFVVLRYLQQKTGMTENEIRKTLSKMQLSKIKNNNEIAWMKSVENEHTQKLQQILKLKTLPNIIQEKSINKYIPAYL